MSAGKRGGSKRSAAKRKAPAPPIEYSLLLTATLCLLALGAIMVFSASSARSLLSEGGGDGAYYLKRMAIFAVAGLLAMRLATIRGARVARALTPLVVTVAMMLLFAVLLPGVGETVNGAQRWIGAGLVSFQPSEVAKLALILYGAHLIANRPRRIESLSGLAPYLLVAGLALVMIAAQPDLGSTIVGSLGVFCLLVAAGVRMRTLAPVGIGLLCAGLAVIAINPYQQERLTGFLSPGGDVSGAGFQTAQATIAIGSGGVTGVGLGESVQKAFYLPEAHTDMIAAVLGEEAGFAGMLVLIGLFGMFGYAGLRAAHRARDRYAKLLAAGLTSLILAQAAVNLFAVLGLAPVTGVPLPFVSYGGSSLVVTLAAAGLLLNVARTGGVGASAGSRRGATGRTRSAGAPGAAAKLRKLEGGRVQIRRTRVGDERRHSRGGNGGSRGPGDRRRRRASR